MIISPPFLPSQPGHEMDSADAGNTIVPDHDVCAAGMQECAPGNGAFPVSFNLGWHGGPHLVAPRNANGHAEPVRAIADGIVVYARQTSPDGTAALQYRNVRTDDGCVVIKHSTEIGEGDSAKVTYFSIYMHLQTVAVPPTAVGKKVYRKDVLGVPGQIYGQLGQIHFEVVCNDTNLRKIVGRSSGQMTGSGGRTDAIYGDVWFKIPRGAKIFDSRPHPYRRDDSENTFHNLLQQQPHPTPCEYVLRMRYKKGDCTLTTFQKQEDGRHVEVGSQPANEYEYDLYKEASGLSARYVELNQIVGSGYAVVPAPSVIFEMLRFGRCLGLETLPPNSKFGHWRKIKTPGAIGWINLNLPEIGVYSDADFPHWAGWSLIDDDTTAISLCTSPTIRHWLDLNGDGQITHDEAVHALQTTSVQNRLSKAICKFPVEWSKDENVIKARWGWVMKPSEALSTQLPSDDFDNLKKHIKTLAFWEDINDPEFPPGDHCWHFPPKAFVEHFRKCEWLSLDEITQLLPRQYGLNHAGSTLDWETARRRLNGGTIQYSDLCKMFRKYCFSTADRQIAFLCQSYIETGLLRTSSEDGEGQGTNGNAPYYTAFYGRGLMQLTWPTLYSDYGKFRDFPNNNSSHYKDPRITATSHHHWSGPPSVDAHGHQHIDLRRWAPRFDPDVVSSASLNACDSAGFFWFWKHFMGKTNILRLADDGITTRTVGKISVLVNGGANGYDDRQQYAAFILRYRGDLTETSASTTLTYHRQRLIPHPHQNPTWGEATQLSNVYVSYTRQSNA